MSALSRALFSRRRKYYEVPGRSLQQRQQQMMLQRREQIPSISNGSSENGTDQEEIPTPSSPPVNNGDINNSPRIADSPTNLDRFLNCTTPMVRARHLPKTIIRTPGGRTIEIEHPPYFVLKDLWDSFEEWSAMAIGIPLIMYGTDSEEYSVTQYYVPHLSGIQLYTHPKRPPTIRMPDGTITALQVAWSRNEIADENISRLIRLSPTNRPFRGWSSLETVETKPLGHLLFEYYEVDRPSNRGPLFGRILNLAASECPALMTYRSCDLSPSSWISVLWSPIYKIPDGPHLPKVETSFLTYHCLSTQSPGTSTVGPPFQGFNVGSEMSSKLPVHAFGLAFYKLRISLWITTQVIESEKANFLWQEAKNCLTRLRVHHPDFAFFGNRPYIKEPNT